MLYSIKICLISGDRFYADILHSICGLVALYVSCQRLHVEVLHSNYK